MFARMRILALVAVVLVALLGCSKAESKPEQSSAPEVSYEEQAEAERVAQYIDAFTEVTPASPNEKAVAAKADTFHEAWADYKLKINAEKQLPSLEELGGNPPKFIGYKVDAYSGKDANGDSGQFSLIVSGDQMNIATKVGYKEPIDLTDQSTLDYFSTRTPLDTWDADPRHDPVSEGEKAAVKKVQDFVRRLPKELLFSPERVRLGGYTLFWGESPSSEAFLIMSVQPGENAHYASSNYGPLR